MKKLIKIIKCSSPDYWYSKHIDEFFTVTGSVFNGKYKIEENGSNTVFLIDVNDSVIISEEKIEVGDKVHYRRFVGSEKVENGIVKEIVDSENTRVVYNCGGDWDNYQSYTAALTANYQLNKGWIEK